MEKGGEAASLFSFVVFLLFFFFDQREGHSEDLKGAKGEPTL